MTKKEVLTKQWAIHLYYKRGWSMQRIGDKYGISRERVRQLMERWGLPRNTKRGGRRVWEEKRC